MQVCIFCYGQTGSGKTFTMQGPEGKVGPARLPNLMAAAARLTPEMPPQDLALGDADAGLITRSCEQIFETAAGLAKDGWSFEVR